MPNFCSQFLGLKAQIMKNVPVGISESFARLRFSFPAAGFFGASCGQIRGRQSLKTPYNNFASPSPRFSFPLAGFLAAGCGQIRGHKCLKTPYNNFASPSPRFSFPVAGFLGGRLRPDKGAQVPENSLEQFRQPKPQILISCGWIFWWPAAAR